MLAVLGVGAFVAVKGLRGAVGAAGGAIVDAAGAVILGADDALGLPKDIMDFPPGFAGISDPKIARYVWDHPNGGLSSVLYRATYSATTGAARMPEGSGTAPPAGSALAELFPPFSGVVGDW